MTLFPLSTYTLQIQVHSARVNFKSISIRSIYGLCLSLSYDGPIVLYVAIAGSCAKREKYTIMTADCWVLSRDWVSVIRVKWVVRAQVSLGPLAFYIWYFCICVCYSFRLIIFTHTYCMIYGACYMLKLNASKNLLIWLFLKNLHCIISEANT